MVILIVIYGLFIVTGGAIGYWQTGSVSSLMSGSLLGLSLLICSWAVFKKRRWALPLSLVLLTVLSCIFGFRFLATHLWLPGLLSILNLGVLGSVFFKLCSR